MQAAVTLAQSMTSRDQQVYVPSPDAFPPVPSSEALPRAPWLRNSLATFCLICSKEFGVFNWRHHCRACGGLFCDSCSRNKAKGIPGYDPQREERVCDICYFHDYAVVVAWNEFVGGWKYKFFCDFVDAHLCFKDISEYASRVSMKVGSGYVYESYFKNELWKQRVMDYAYRKGRKVLKPRIPLLWHLNAEQQEPITALSVMPSVFQSSQPNADPLQQQVTLMATAPPVEPIAPNPTTGNISPRDVAQDEVKCAIAVVFRQSDGEAQEHTWLYFTRATAVEITTEAARFLRNIPRLSYGGVVDMEGNTLQFDRNPNDPAATTASPAAYANMFRGYVENMSVVMITDRGDDGTFFPKLRMALDAIHALDGPGLLLDIHGNIVLTKRCSSTMHIETLAKRAGALLLRQQSISVLIACGSNSVTHVFEDMFTARQFMVINGGFALFAVPTIDERSPAPPTCVLLQRHLFMSKSEALQLAQQAQEKTQSLVRRQRIVIPEVEVRATNSAVAQVPECGICFLSYDVNDHRPCLCAKCGNSLCFTCIRSVSLCPFCRKELPVSGPFITNVQLLQILSGANE